MKKDRFLTFLLIILLFQLNCSRHKKALAQYADVIAVDVSGNPDDYNFSVTVKSPDKGCEQYADWWEVISPDGDLIYRRILLHSHTNEQPFTRSGGKVDIGPGTRVIVRAHMNTSGYGGKAMGGSVENGFKEVKISHDFADSLEKTDPLPSDCAY